MCSNHFYPVLLASNQQFPSYVILYVPLSFSLLYCPSFRPRLAAGCQNLNCFMRRGDKLCTQLLLSSWAWDQLGMNISHLGRVALLCYILLNLIRPVHLVSVSPVSHLLCIAFLSVILYDWNIFKCGLCKLSHYI